MTMSFLDSLRGYGIGAVILAFSLIGVASTFIPENYAKLRAYLTGFAGVLGGIGSIGVFFLFTFNTGWEEYFDSKTTGQPVEYRGRHQGAAAVIRVLGEMEVSTLGIVFGIVGVVFLWVAFISFRSLIKT